jgi:hypothetical protein
MTGTNLEMGANICAHRPGLEGVQFFSQFHQPRQALPSFALRLQRTSWVAGS